SYDAAARRVTLGIAASALPLPDGAYSVVIKGSDARYGLLDLAGNALGGVVDATSSFTLDTTPPQVASFDPPGGQVRNQAITQIRVQFTEPVRDAGPSADHSASNPASYAILSAGADGTFGTADDAAIPIASASYDAAARRTTLTPSGGQALPDGSYR